MHALDVHGVADENRYLSVVVPLNHQKNLTIQEIQEVKESVVVFVFLVPALFFVMEKKNDWEI